MKVLTTTGLTKLIELIKNTFLDKTNTIDVSESLATVAITGSYNDLSNKPTIPTVNIDETTISYNASNALQTIAVKNKRDDSTLPIWHGTEQQWLGDPIVWYNWKSEVNSWNTANVSDTTTTSTFGNNKFLILQQNNVTYSTDGINWTTVPTNITVSSRSVVYGNELFVATRGAWTNYSIYSTDGINWTQISTSFDFRGIAYGNGKFVSVGYNNNVAYSTDGINWTTVQLSSNFKTNECISFCSDRFIINSMTNKGAYSIDGINWTEFEVSNTLSEPHIFYYNDNKFIAIARNNDDNVSDKGAYSTDGINWTPFTLPVGSYWNKIEYDDGKFILHGSYYDSSEILQSTNGINWTSLASSLSGYIKSSVYKNGKLVIIFGGTKISTYIENLYCYTMSSTPTTSSTIYLEPNNISSLTITSVDSGTITLSDTYTYNYNQSGNQQIYQTIGDAHPEYLAFITGKGVKMGNNWIATNSPITTTLSTSSTDAEVPSAKAVYTEMNKVNLTVNLSFVSGSISNGSFKFVIDGNTYTFSDFTNNQMTIKIPSNSNISWEAEYSGKSLAWSDGTNSGSGTTSNGTLVATDDVTLTFTFKYTSDYGSGDEPS